MSSLTLKVKTKQGEQIVTGLQANHTIEQLKTRLASLTNIQPDRLNVLMGFPPKKLDLSDNALSLEASGVQNGVKLIVDESAVPVVIDKAAVSDEVCEPAGVLVRKEVPSDNSCLFTSIGSFGTLIKGNIM